MAENTLSILKPSVNNLSARVFVRAAGLDFDEVDMWGNKGTPEFLAKDPADLTPLLECEGLSKGSLWESCAIMQYLCNKHGLDQLYPTNPAERAMTDSAMFYVIGTLYPLIARATYPTLNFPSTPARSAPRRRRCDEGEGAEGRGRRDRPAARGVPLLLPRREEVHRRRAALDRRHPPRRVARVPAGDRLPVPRLVEEYMSAVEVGPRRRLPEPAAEVREFVGQMKDAAATA